MRAQYPGARVSPRNMRIGAFFGMDVIVSAIVLLAFMRFERRRASIPHSWAPVAGTLLVGVSFGLPLFLYLREVSRENQPS